MPQSIVRLKRDWEDLADFDPFWAVLTRRDKKNRRWALDEFFATGTAEIDKVLNQARAFSRPVGHERALDYGCGVGRLTRALASHFSVCTGVDIAERMVEMARELNSEIPQCNFLVGNGTDLRSTVADRSIDFVYCSLVLQHLPDVRMAEALILEFLRIAKADGLVVFQMPSRIEIAAKPRFRRRLYMLLRRLGVNHRFLMGPARSNPMRMNAIPENRIRSLIADAGGRLVLATPDLEADPRFSSTIYYVLPVSS